MTKHLKPTSEFGRNVLTLMTGTSIAQAIPIAITPILTRLYEPENFGVFALFIAITAVFATIANGRYEFAIMLPKKDEDAIHVMAVGFVINLIVTVALFVSVIFFYTFWHDFIDYSGLGFWLFIIPLSVFFSGAFNLLNYFNTRKKYYKDLRNATVFKSVVLVIIQLSIGMIKGGVTGLIAGQVLAQLAANAKLLRNLLEGNQPLGSISKIKVLALAKKYKDFPKHNAPAALADTAALQLPSLLLPKLFGLATSGYFFLAHKMIAIPGALIGGSISQVFFQELSAQKNMRSKCWPFFVNTVKRLLCMGLPISLFIALLGPSLFQIVFGEQWKVSGEVARYLSIVFLCRFVVSPVSSVFSVSGYLKRGAFWKYLYLTTSISIFAYTVLVGLDFLKFVLLFTVHEVVLYSIYFYLVVRSVRQMDAEV
jgi:O-antigen/teichoic acid export membrane protein